MVAYASASLVFLATPLPSRTLGGTTAMEYKEIAPLSRELADEILGSGEETKLISAVIAVPSHEPNFQLAQNYCVELSNHRNPNVRGNTILGFKPRLS